MSVDLDCLSECFQLMHAPDLTLFPYLTQAQISDLQQLLLSKNAKIDSLHAQLLARPLSSETSERGKHFKTVFRVCYSVMKGLYVLCW